MKYTALIASALLVATPVAALAHQPADAGQPPMGRDSDGDGKISRDEAKTAAAAGFRRMDTNGDGIITAAEHEALAMSRFDTVDTNEDGFVDRDERRAAAPERGGRRDRGGRGGN